MAKFLNTTGVSYHLEELIKSTKERCIHTYKISSLHSSIHMKILVLIVLSFFTLVSCETKTVQNTKTQTIDVDQQGKSDDKTNPKTDKKDTNITIEAKTTDEVYVEAGLKVGGIVLDKLKEKRKRDSTELANRGKILVYQIGMPKTDKDELWNSYSKIKNLPNVYAFKDDDTYYLIKIENYTEQDMQDSLVSITNTLSQKGMNERVDILNILGKCKRKETIVHGKKVKIKHHEDIPCYTCN